MFTMMNRARLAVGLQGVWIAERATQQAVAYARERRQGRDSRLCRPRELAPISRIPTSSACSMTMRALTQAARSICYVTALALDRAERGADKAAGAATKASVLEVHRKDNKSAELLQGTLDLLVLKAVSLGKHPRIRRTR